MIKSDIFSKNFLITAIFIFINVEMSQLWSQTPLPPKVQNETYKDIIQKAQSLILQKDRAQAILILESSLQKETTKKSKEFIVDELKSSLFNMSRLFLSDKAHGLFELALSLLPNEPVQAQQRLEEALKIENDNLQIINQMMRTHLMKKECDNARAVFNRNKLDKRILFDNEIELINAQIEYCSDRFEGVLKKIEKKDLKKADKIKMYWLELEALRSVKERNFARAKDSIGEIKKMDSNYIELSYLEWLLEFKSENSKGSMTHSQKYLVSCRNLSSIKLRNHLLNPWLCQRVSEVEGFQNSVAN